MSGPRSGYVTSESVRDIERGKPAQSFGCGITNSNIPVISGAEDTRSSISKR